MMMPLVGAGAACALVGFPKTKLVDDSPLIGAGECLSYCTDVLGTGVQHGLRCLAAATAGWAA